LSLLARDGREKQQEDKVTDFPSYQEFVDSLTEKAGGREVDPDVGLFEQKSLDSIDVIEWLYSLEDKYQTNIGQDLLDFVGTKSVRDLYAILSTWQPDS
jgi:acyl carrier protein